MRVQARLWEVHKKPEKRTGYRISEAHGTTSTLQSEYMVLDSGTGDTCLGASGKQLLS